MFGPVCILVEEIMYSIPAVLLDFTFHLCHAKWARNREYEVKNVSTRINFS